MFSEKTSRRMTGEELRRHAESASKLLLTIGNPVRLMILCLLLDDEKSVSELNEEIDLSQSALSQHLAVLRQEGLVETRRKGVLIFYRLAEHEVRAVMQCLYHIYCE